MIDSNLMRRLAVTAGFVLLMVAYHSIFRGYYPLPDGLMGHDYALTLTSFEDGYLWFRNNGFLVPPWFTPSFCAGQPFFADPQSIFYSVPQFLTFVFNPLKAVYISVLLFAGLGFWGTYFLARRSFGLNAWAAFAAATVFMFNGFYSHRMIVGHFGYQPYMLVPLVAWLLIGGLRSPEELIKRWMYVLSAGLLIAYWLQAGLTTLMVPAGLSVIALGSLASFRERTLLSRMMQRGVWAVLIALTLSASKLSASLALMSHFPRDYYPLPGIADIGGLLKFVFQALFYSSEHAYQTANPLWQNMEWVAMPHELAYGITLVPLFIMLVGAWLYLRRRVLAQGGVAEVRRPWLAGGILLSILFIPLAMLYYSPGWNAVLKSLPLFGSTTSPFRWLIIYIPVLAVLSAIAADARSDFSKLAAILCLVGVPGLNALENRDFYRHQDFDPMPVIRYDKAVRSGAIRPQIHAIGLPKDKSAPILDNNVMFTDGISPLICYNPLFGYGLEKYKVGQLHAGSVFELNEGGYLNFRNPACLVFPGPNHCAPWDAFREADIGQLRNFVNYRPFVFQRGSIQRIADAVTMASLFTCFAALLVLFYVVGRRGSIKEPGS
jgi:hypothetical protein